MKTMAAAGGDEMTMAKIIEEGVSHQAIKAMTYQRWRRYNEKAIAGGNGAAKAASMA